MAVPVVDKFTFASDDLWLSEFRLPPAHPDWHRARQTTDGAFLIAFPRTTVAIRHEDRHEVVADPMSAVVYGPGQAYRRRLISAAGDDCTVVAVSPQLVARVAHRFDAKAGSDAYRTPFVAANVGRASHMTIEKLRRLVARQGAVDADVVTEELYVIVDQIFSSGYVTPRWPQRLDTAAAQRDMVEAVREELGRDLAAAPSLDELATHVAVSPFHMARIFRGFTGRPIHAYRNELRLRSSLPMIADGMRLADVAQNNGFASHAHLTDRFVRAYGMTPTRWRETSKNMEAPRESAFIA